MRREIASSSFHPAVSCSFRTKYTCRSLVSCFLRRYSRSSGSLRQFAGSPHFAHRALSPWPRSGSTMMSATAPYIDAFGREHFTVSASSGKLGIALGASDNGFIIVSGIDSVQISAGVASWRDSLRVGDRLVRIEDTDVTHCSLREVIARLGKLAAAFSRRLTFARYHEVSSNALFGEKYDPEKLVLVRAPGGPLGLILDEKISHAAYISGFQPLPDGSIGPLEQLYPQVHHGCQIVAVNGTDVSTFPRDAIRAMLGALKNQEKQVILYRAVPLTCAGLLQFEMTRAGDITRRIMLDDTDQFHAVVASIDADLSPHLQPGDRLIAVNGADVSYMSRSLAMEALGKASAPITLVFSRHASTPDPECHAICVESGPLGLNLDSSHPEHAIIAGFTSPEDATRPVFLPCVNFLPNSYIVAINGLEVYEHSLAKVSQLLIKLRGHTKNILFGNQALVQLYLKNPRIAAVCVPPGPLGIEFDSQCTDAARVSGFFSANGEPGAIQLSGKVSIGATLCNINGLDVSNLPLVEVTSLLRNMANKSKTIQFTNTTRSGLPHTVRVRVPPGPLGVDLKQSTANSHRVAVDRLNQDRDRGSTFIFDYGGVVPGSEIIAIDDFSVEHLDLNGVISLLKMLTGFEKVITFATTTEAYSQMLSSDNNTSLQHVTVTKSPLGIEFDSATPHKAVISAFSNSSMTSEIAMSGISVGSRLVAINCSDVRALSLQDIAGILKGFAGVEILLTFQMPTSVTKVEGLPSPQSPKLRVTTQLPAHESLLHRSQSVATVTSTGEMSPVRLGRENSMPPVPVTLQPLEIRPVEVQSSTGLEASKETVKRAIVEEEPTIAEFLVTMPTWTGARAQHLLQVDTDRKFLQLIPTKATSPTKLGKSPSTELVIPFVDISSIDWGRQGKASPTRGLFRSASSLTSSSSQLPRYTVVISTFSGKKGLEVDMCSAADRDALEAVLTLK